VILGILANSAAENEVLEFFRMLILLFAGLAATISAAAEPVPQSVLIVSQWDTDLPFSMGVSSAFKASLGPAAQLPGG
jgi:hypothetical protein